MPEVLPIFGPARAGIFRGHVRTLCQSQAETPLIEHVKIPSQLSYTKSSKLKIFDKNYKLRNIFK